MKGVQAKPLLLDLFHRLRRAGADLGIGELLAAYRAVDGRWGGAATARPCASSGGCFGASRCRR
jgi:hypothetical protein